MKYAITILIVGALLAAQSESRFKPSKLLRKISIKSYRHFKRIDLDTKLDDLDDLFDEFGSIADEFSVHGGSFTLVEDHWKKCNTAFQAIKTFKRQLNRYKQSELEKEDRTKRKIVSVKNRIIDAKNDYSKQNDVYRACGNNAKKANASKRAHKKEEIKIPIFDPETLHWDSWSIQG